MNKRRNLYLLIGAGVAILVFLAGFLINSGSQKKTIPANSTGNSTIQQTTDTTTKQNVVQDTPTLGNLSPEETTKVFYSWYLAQPGITALTSGSYKTSPYLTTSYKENIARFAPYNPNYDSVFCNPNKIKNFTVQSATSVAEGKVNVIIAENVPNGRKLYRVVLVNENNHWLINDTLCIPAGY